MNLIQKFSLLQKVSFSAIFFLFSTFLLHSQAAGQATDKIQPIEPPFGLSWGESPENVWKWTKDNKYGSAQGRMPDGRQVIEIFGPFPDTEFDRLRFYFSEKSLTEVELQFIQTGHEEDGVEFEAINKAMAIKHRIDTKLGKGRLIKNETGKDGTSTWKFIQQIWTDEEHSIWLAVFNSTSDKREMLSMVSLHYRWETKINEKNAAEPAKKLDEKAASKQ